jgi:ABC-type multidrug transport system fused ATPase/permease subunit
MASPHLRNDPEAEAGWGTLRRFLPYLWPAGERALKARVVLAVVLVFIAKAATLALPFANNAAIDRWAGGVDAAAGLVIALVVAYAGARFAGVLFDNLRNAIFERVGQDAARRLAEHVFRHIHRLSLRYHLERRTGALTKIVERGTKSIDMMLYFLLFNIAPTVIELAAICIIFGIHFGPGLALATLAMVGVYIVFTRVVTEWRAKLQREMNEVDNEAIARAVDSLLNYETVKYFGAEEREARRYGQAVSAFANAAVRNETSLAWLNIGQSLITNLMMAGAMGYTVWGWSRGTFTTGDVVFVNTFLAQLFRPLDMLGWVYRTVRQGLGGDQGRARRRAAASHRRPCPLRERRLRLRSRAPDPERRRHRRAAGKHCRGGRPVRRRQIDPVTPRISLLRPDRRANHHRRPGHLPCVAGEPAPSARHRPAGQRPVQRLDRLQYRLREGRRLAGRDRGRGPRRLDPRLHRRPAAGL